MVSAKPMKNSDERLLISVIKQYYELGMSQEEIAAKEYISKSTISRLINKAIKKGYVKIKSQPGKGSRISLFLPKD